MKEKGDNFITTKQAGFILGKSLRSAQREFKKLRIKKNMFSKARITIRLFCEAFLYSIDYVYERLYPSRG